MKRTTWFLQLINCFTYLILISDGQEVCKVIELSGAKNHPLANGLYYYTDEIHCNSRPLWVDAAQHHFVYYLLDGYDGWMVSAESCYKWGNFKLKVRSNEAAPYNVSHEDWSEYSPEKALWEKSDTFQITCSAMNYIKPVFVSTPTPKTVPNGHPDTDVDANNSVLCLKLGLALTALLLVLLFTIGIIICRCARYYRKMGIASSSSSSFKYKPLNENITAYPA